MPDHSKWANAQIAIAVALGINPLDAAEAMRALLAKLPEGADPATYVFSAEQLTEDILTGQAYSAGITSEVAISDARAAWYERVEPRFARLLDAGEA